MKKKNNNFSLPKGSLDEKIPEKFNWGAFVGQSSSRSLRHRGAQETWVRIPLIANFN